MRTYLACKTKINWKENMWNVVSRLGWVPTSLYTSFLSVNFGRNMPDSCTAFGCTNRRSNTSLQFYCIPLAKQYSEQQHLKFASIVSKCRVFCRHISYVFSICLSKKSRGNWILKNLKKSTFPRLKRINFCLKKRNVLLNKKRYFYFLYDFQTFMM